MAYDSRLLTGVTVLMAVVEAGTMARAAEALGMTASGVGRAIARLETRIGIRLLERTTRSLRLTDEGRKFYEQVGPHLDGIEDAALEASGSAGVVKGRLRVNVAPIVSQTILSDRMGAFLADYPELRVEMIMRDAVGDLVADGFDMALRFGDPPENLIARRLADMRVITAASPTYIARRGRPSHPSELIDHETIDFWDPVKGRAYDWEFHRDGETLPVKTRARLMTSDAATMLASCLAGVGICQIPPIGAHHLFARGDLIDLFPDWPGERFPLYALYPPRQKHSAKVRAFVTFVEGLITEEGIKAGGSRA
ncbi:LysR family transcriptional regulator [Rhizobium paknamense]|uniref:DNA-binding transcriptional LysR family regulator n=1 Tax=Rhizobium paknamense TaxID=1206817 RepID=A0ABU0IIZ5_9HYPH|nr:LysR family transcriptional regulator [Rhizobium paknamense]MDQ0458236.1 DNA-binding transcriptional LysR family regulator [Rhizobium paknamense]